MHVQAALWLCTNQGITLSLSEAGPASCQTGSQRPSMQVQHSSGMPYVSSPSLFHALMVLTAAERGSL